MASKPRVYIETSVVSYLTARPSRDPYTRLHQELTVRWWTSRAAFDAFVPVAVLEEASRGDPTYSSRRLSAISGLAVLDIDKDVEKLALALIKAAAIPRHAEVDALHVAIAAVHGMHYLVTW